MTKGFYNLTSGILSQSRRLDTVANNMTNLSTSGYKAEQYTDSTFQEVLISRVGNKDKSSPTVIGEESYILAPSQLYVDYSQGSLEETGLTLDFAIEGDGFFAIQTAQGVEYTRSGSFSLDGEGYLCLPAHGRVLGADGQPVYLATDRIRADQAGNLYTEGGGYVGRLGLYAFADNGLLEKNESGLFGANGQAPAPSQAKLHWKWVENANVNMLQEMSDMMTAQRALQSAAQVLTELESSRERGLSRGEAEARLTRYGPNRLEQTRKKSLPLRLLGQLKDPMILVLLAAAGLSLWAGGWEGDPGRQGGAAGRPGAGARRHHPSGSGRPGACRRPHPGGSGAGDRRERPHRRVRPRGQAGRRPSP